MQRLRTWDEPILTWDFGEGSSLIAILVTTTEQALLISGLRHAVYAVELGQVRETPFGLEWDEFDWPRASHLLISLRIKDHSKVIGTARLIWCEYGFLFDGQELGGEVFQFPDRHPESGEVISRSQTFEFSRWIGREIILPEPDGRIVKASNFVIEAAIEATRLLNRKHWVAMMKASALPRLERWLPNAIHRLGVMSLYHGAEGVPTLFTWSAETQYSLPRFRE